MGRGVSSRPAPESRKGAEKSGGGGYARPAVAGSVKERDTGEANGRNDLAADAR